jgi:uncharacterized protein YndB with AHSA1/START domain
MSDPAYIYVVSIKASRELVWRALTDPTSQEAYWFGARSQDDWSVGSKVLMTRDGGVDFTGEVLESDPPSRLVWTFDADNGEGPSHVAYDLETVDGATRLTVTHTGFVDDSRLRVSISHGWPAVLEGLKEWLEGKGASAAA